MIRRSRFLLVKKPDKERNAYLVRGGPLSILPAVESQELEITCIAVMVALLGLWSTTVFEQVTWRSDVHARRHIGMCI
jgi:hypothetical protein